MPPLTARQAIQTLTPTPSLTVAPLDSLPTPAHTSTTTITPHASTTSNTSVPAAGGLAWWQLLCIALAASAAGCVGLWVFWRHRRKVTTEAARRREAELEEGRNAVRRATRSDSEDEGQGRQRPKRRGRYDESESDGYEPRRRTRRSDRAYSDRRRRRRKYDDDGSYPSDDSEYYSRRETKDPRRRPLSPITPKSRRPRDTFRDSVFSTYASMKSAAVKLKHVEARTKFKRQMRREEELEQERKDRVDKANQKGWLAGWFGQGGNDDGKLQVPPVMTDSPTSLPSMLTPPSRARIKARWHDTQDNDGSPSLSKRATEEITRSRLRSHKHSERIDKSQHASRSRGRSRDAREYESQTRDDPLRHPPRARLPPKPKAQTSFQSEWLAQPHAPVRKHTGPVTIPITHPRDRPTIPKGALALPPKAKSHDLDQSRRVNAVRPDLGVRFVSNNSSSQTSVTSSSGRWTDRLKERR